MFSSLEDRIKSAKLTRSERVVAEYIANNLNSACFMTAVAIARETKVSNSSVIRLSRALGYDGYQYLQKDIQELVRQQMEDGNEAVLSPLEKIRQGLPLSKKPDLLGPHFDHCLANIKSVLEKNRPEKFDLIASELIRSRQKVIAGFRGCRGLADWMSVVLGHVLPDVRKSIVTGSDSLESILDLTPEDCVLIISFSRYAQAAIDTAAFARERAAKVIVLTDKLTSPVASFADHVAIMDVQGISSFNSLTAPSFTIEMIMASVIKAVGLSSRDRLELVDKYVSKHKFF